MVTVLPWGKSVVPLNVGVASLLTSSGSSVKLGAAVSMLPCSDAVSWLPASSVTVAVTVKLPSARSAGTSTEKVPSFATIASKVCVLPALSVTAIETVLPGA